MLILLFHSICYASNFNIQISPDTIYVGTLATIHITVNDLQEDEFPVFSEIGENSAMFTLVKRTLNRNSVIYVLQIWESGLLSIPSITASINRNKQEILYLESGIIEILILSKINSFIGYTTSPDG